MESMNQWFARILSEYNITPAEIKRRSGLSESHMSKVLKGERGFGEDAIRKIAKAVGVAPEVFFREVGILPPAPERTQAHEQLLFLFDRLNDKDRQTVLDMMQFLLSK
jgi:transcriptional regulator with XRE-family HTH domain